LRMPKGADNAGWRRALRFDPVPALLSAKSEQISYFARRDLLEQDAGPVSKLRRTALRSARSFVRCSAVS
jgi:hypothetical protein